MFRKRNTRTDLEIVAAGDFVKVGKKHFRHESGVEIEYDCNHWGWRISTDRKWLYGTLEVAVYNVRKAPVLAA